MGRAAAAAAANDDDVATAAAAPAPTTSSGSRPERVRPRRLEPDTLAYLKEVAETLVSDGEDLGPEDAQLMLWNVLEELAPRAASAASDRHAGELLETFLPRMSDGQLRFLLSKMEGYVSHLWTNRYSSHVLQNLLARASAIVAREVEGLDDDDDQEDDERLRETPRMSELIVNMVSEVEGEWLTLLNDVSASHVLRSVLAVLGGRALLPEKRGKKAKHRSATYGSDGPRVDAAATATYATPASFGALYQQILRRVRAAPHSELLNLLYDRNSGPLLAMATRLAPSASARDKLLKHIFQWSEEEAPAPTTRTAQVFYDFAGDAVSSHFLEAVFQSIDDAFFAEIFRRCLQGRLVEFSEHHIANYVVQQAVQRIQEPTLAREVLTELEGAVWVLLGMGRAGVVWRLVEMSRRLAIDEEAMFRAVVEAVNKQEAKKPTAAQRSLVPALLGLQLATTGGDHKVQLNVMGAKMLGEWIQRPYAAWLTPVYEGILGLNTAQLLALAMDSTGSRFVVEPLWETTDDARAWVRARLFAKFVGHFATLALDRLGAFSVIKCYERLALADKAVVAEELAQVETQLSGSHFSQLVMNTVHLYEYRNNRERWEALYEKKDKIADLFKDLVDEDGEKSKSKKSKKRKASANDGDVEAQDEDRAARKLKKKAAKLEAKRKASKDPKAEGDVEMILDVLRGGDHASGTNNRKKKKHKKHDD